MIKWYVTEIKHYLQLFDYGEKPERNSSIVLNW